MSTLNITKSEAVTERKLNGKNILLVEDDQALRGVLAVILEKQGAEVATAENGLVGQRLLNEKQGAFDLVISDIRMPQMDGIALLKFCKSTYPAVRFMIFTGFSEVLESQTAHEMGADGFLAKPFTMDDLKKTAFQIFDGKPSQDSPVPPAAAPEFDESTLCRIHVDEFLTTTRLLSDIYVRAGRRFIKVAKEGSEIQVSRIQTYKDKKVDFFYVPTSDFHRYTGLNLKLARAAGASRVVTREQKLRLFRSTGEILVQQVFISGLQSQLCEETQGIVSNTLNMIGESNELTEILILLESRGDTLYAHSLGTSAYACMIARKLGWASTQNQYKLTMAGLYHDLGLKEVPSALHNKPRVLMTADEVRLYETHPARGRELLLSLRGFPGDLAQIIFEHHENQIGTGYPQGLHGVKIHPMAKVLRVADEFCERALGCRGLAEAQQIALEMYQTKGDEFSAEVMGALFDVLTLERPTGLRRKPAIAA